MRPKLYTSKRWLYKKFITERLKEEEIAKLAGTSQPTIHRWLIKFELKKER